MLKQPIVLSAKRKKRKEEENFIKDLYRKVVISNNFNFYYRINIEIEKKTGNYLVNHRF